MKSSIAALVLVLSLGGCVSGPDDEYRPVEVSHTSGVSAAEVDLRADGVHRAMREATLRIRARHCDGVGNGSGFAVGDRVLVTNRHVVRGADVVQISTWDGRSVDVEISGYAIANDLAVVLTEQDLPRTLPVAPSPAPGERVVAVGYPAGDQLSFASGTVVDYVDGHHFAEASQTMRVTNRIIPGNSGGPLVNEDAEVVGVVFAVETTGRRHGLVIPVESLQANIAAGGFFDNPSPC